MESPRTDTHTLAQSMRILAGYIESDDGVANAAIAESAIRLEEMHALLARCKPHVMASHGAEHMMDGFRPRAKPIDSLVSALLVEIPDE